MKKNVASMARYRAVRRIAPKWGICGGAASIVPILTPDGKSREYSGDGRLAFDQLVASLPTHSVLSRQHLRSVETFVDQHGFCVDSIFPQSATDLLQCLPVVACVLQSKSLFQILCESIGKQSLIHGLTTISLIDPPPTSVDRKQLKARFETVLQLPGFWFDPHPSPPILIRPTAFHKKWVGENPGMYTDAQFLKISQYRPLNQVLPFFTEATMVAVAQALLPCVTPHVAAAFLVQLARTQLLSEPTGSALLNVFKQSDQLPLNWIVGGLRTLLDDPQFFPNAPRGPIIHWIGKLIKIHDPNFKFSGSDLTFFGALNFFDRAAWVRSGLISISDFLDRSMLTLMDQATLILHFLNQKAVPPLPEPGYDHFEPMDRAGNRFAACNLWPSDVRVLAQKNAPALQIESAKKWVSRSFLAPLAARGIVAESLVSESKIWLETVAIAIADLQSTVPHETHQLSLLRYLCQSSPSPQAPRFHTGDAVRDWLNAGGDPESAWRSCIETRRQEVARGQLGEDGRQLAVSWANWMADALRQPTMMRHIRTYHFISDAGTVENVGLSHDKIFRSAFLRLLFPAGDAIPLKAWGIVADAVAVIAPSIPDDQRSFFWRGEMTWFPILLNPLPPPLAALMNEQAPDLLTRSHAMSLLTQPLDRLPVDDRVNVKQRFFDQLTDMEQSEVLSDLVKDPRDIVFIRHLASKWPNRVYNAIPFCINTQTINRVFGEYSPVERLYHADLAPVIADIRANISDIEEYVFSVSSVNVLSVFSGFQDPVRSLTAERIKDAVLNEFYKISTAVCPESGRTRLAHWTENRALVIATAKDRCVYQCTKSHIPPASIRSSVKPFDWEWRPGQDVLESFQTAILSWLEDVRLKSLADLDQMIESTRIYESELKSFLNNKMNLSGYSHTYRQRFLESNDAKLIIRAERKRMIRSHADFIVAHGVWPIGKKSCSTVEFIHAVVTLKSLQGTAQDIRLPYDFLPAFPQIRDGGG